MRIEAIGANENELMIIDGDSVLIGSVKCLSSISEDFLLSLASEEERNLVIKETRSFEYLLVDTLLLDVAYLCDDLIMRIMLSLEVYAQGRGLTAITLYASEIATASVYEDLGYQTKGHLSSVNLRLLKKNLLVS